MKKFCRLLAVLLSMVLLLAFAGCSSGTTVSTSSTVARPFGSKPNMWVTGETVPTVEQGLDGDLYLDYSTWNVYMKVNGFWIPLGNISFGESTMPEHSHRFTAVVTGRPCDPEGYVTYSCECGYSFVVENYLGHVFDNGTCIYCGQTPLFTFSGYTAASGMAGVVGDTIPDVEIVLRNDEGTEYKTRSNGEGYYEIPDLPAGHYHATFTVQDENFESVEFEFDLEADLTKNVFFDYQQDSTLTGKVTVADSDLDYSNNSPLPGATVTLTKGDIFRRSTTTEADGTYRFEGLPSGSYRMSIEKEGYIPLVQNIEIARGVINVQNVILELIQQKPEVTTGSAAGMVYDALVPGEVGIEGLTLSVRGGINNLTGDVLTTLQTGVNGAYLLENFPAGNYTIEIHDGRVLENEALRYHDAYFNVKIIAGEVIYNQNGSTTNGEKVGQLRIKLSWGSEPADLDSHLTGPEADGSGRFHIYYQSQSYTYNSTVYADLDRDDTDCFGPETTTIYVESEGVYRFSVHDFSNRTNSSSRGIATSGATVEVYFGERLYYTFHAPDEAGTVWTVFEYDSTTKQVTQIGTMGNSIT